ncbi:hypothetical protein [Oceanibacterium hippocampi]|uniref:Uncharacterized protein n=1 Tax=Oceanibacterium hippocampi TaxID=745714 RepID=A0A1Y5T0P5_9PROT|nr:hypothetical protein [Oceanibacterium hippocampi]SLN53316.1 hypothetical protein OCH7691_02229 [Oceanibacterium hippocampi]
MVFFRRSKAEDVTEGAVFERHCASNFIETAKVVWIGKDSTGIPHVRYETALMGQGRFEPQGIRILALKSFADRFRHRCERNLAQFNA